MKSINIKGKNYIEVNERIKEFRSNEKYNWYSMTSEIISIENGVCIIKAVIKNENWIEVANWLAYEKENSSFINKTSYIENCETSAWWRALWNLWIWIDTSIASYEEVANAIQNQNNEIEKKWITDENIKNIQELINKWRVITIQDCYDRYKISNDSLLKLKNILW
jgi:hypothetical protein